MTTPPPPPPAFVATFVPTDQTWPELVYIEPGERFIAHLTNDRLDYTQLDWRQRALIRAMAGHVLTRLDAADAAAAGWPT